MDATIVIAIVGISITEAILLLYGAVYEWTCAGRNHERSQMPKNEPPSLIDLILFVSASVVTIWAILYFAYNTGLLP